MRCSAHIEQTLMIRACSELREALAKVSSSTKTAFLRRSFCRDSRLEVISERLPMAALHLSLPFPFSSITLAPFHLFRLLTLLLIGLFPYLVGLLSLFGPNHLSGEFETFFKTFQKIINKNSYDLEVCF